MKDESTGVIVAGGGPVGLMAAAMLDAAGVRVEVFERNTGPSTHSKATTIHPRTLEVLTMLEGGDGRRLADVLLDLGRRATHTHFATLPAMLDYSTLDTPYPFVLMVPQVTTELTLVAYLAERGVPVYYGREVTGFEQHGDGVRVRIGDTVRDTGYLVGADGARSLVRRQAGIEFVGDAPTMVGFGGDVTLAEEAAGPRHRWFHDRGSVSIVPLPDGMYRVFGAEPAATGLSSEQVRVRQAEPLSLTELRATVRRILGSDSGIQDASWLFRSTNSTRHATSYRAGRVLLAGDAAHVHLPAGGQGMNVGLQDAANLAWKLAAEIGGLAPAELVDGEFSYDHERRRVAELLVDNTLAQDALMYTFSPSGAALRSLFSGLIEQGGTVSDELAGWVSGLSVSYPRPPGSHPLVGTRAPDLAVAGGGLLRAVRPDRFLLLDFSPGGALTSLASSQVDVLAARPRQGVWAGLAGALIRPDGYVAQAGDAGELASAVAQWTGSAPTALR
jgi:2-polyprenyl-6-methoxyphenol hydroxylase-like FAD-dependent oxidoreductase